MHFRHAKMRPGWGIVLSLGAASAAGVAVDGPVPAP